MAIEAYTSRQNSKVKQFVIKIYAEKGSTAKKYKQANL